MPDHRQRPSRLAVIPSVVLRDAADDFVGAPTNVADEALTSIEIAVLRRRLRTLDPLEARVLRWTFGLDGPPLTLRQVAARLGYSPAGVHKIKHRALARLRELYDEELCA
jgi:DNA-directed RNA polymerase sigma subunit (sigma70/sigma32)